MFDFFNFTAILIVDNRHTLPIRVLFFKEHTEREVRNLVAIAVTG